MSYEIDEDGNKFFYEEGLKDEEQLKSFCVHFSGKMFLNAYDEEHAFKVFNDSDLNDINENIDDINIYED